MQRWLRLRKMRGLHLYILPTTSTEPCTYWVLNKYYWNWYAGEDGRESCLLWTRIQSKARNAYWTYYVLGVGCYGDEMRNTRLFPPLNLVWTRQIKLHLHVKTLWINDSSNNNGVYQWCTNQMYFIFWWHAQDLSSLTEAAPVPSAMGGLES